MFAICDGDQSEFWLQIEMLGRGSSGPRGLSERPQFSSPRADAESSSSDDDDENDNEEHHSDTSLQLG